MDDDWIWPEFPYVGGQGSLHDLSDRDEGPPRLAGMRSVSHAAARALHKAAPYEPRKVGFAHHLVGGTKPKR